MGSEMCIRDRATLDTQVLSELTVRLLNQQAIATKGTYYNSPTQPLLVLHIIGISLIYFTQPLISTGISTPSVKRVCLRYHAINLNLALKSPRIRRTLKPVATATNLTVFSVNPLFLSNCRTRRIRRTSAPHLTLTLKLMTKSRPITHYEE